MADLQHTEGGQSTELTAAPITRKTLSGLYVPADIDGGPEVATAPIDIVDQAPEVVSDVQIESERPIETPEPVPVELSAPESQPARVASAPPPAPSQEPAEFTPFPMERFYPVIYWTSVLIGLVSQVIGWGTVFGGTLRAYVAAAIVGGICELTMVTTSDKGLNWAAQNRHPAEFLPFLLVATIAAHIAVYMVTTHWHGTLGVYLGIVSAAGFLGHMLDGGFKAKRHRVAIQEREKAAAEQAEAERQAAEQARAEKEAAEAERARIEQANAKLAEANQATPSRAKPEPKSAGKGKSKGKGSTKPTATKDVALAVGRRDGICTPAPLRDALDKAGYAPASERAVKGWCAELRKELGTS